jgi:hypothetical protein
MAAVGVLEANITRTYSDTVGNWTSHNKNRRASRAESNNAHGECRDSPPVRISCTYKDIHKYMCMYVWMYVHTGHGRMYVCMCVWWMRVPTAQSLWAPMGGEAAGEQRAAPTWACSRLRPRPRPRPRPPHDQPRHRCRREAEAPEIHARGRSSFGEAVRPMEQDMRSGVWAGGQGPLLADTGGEMGCRQVLVRLPSLSPAGGTQIHASEYIT